MHISLCSDKIIVKISKSEKEQNVVPRKEYYANLHVDLGHNSIQEEYFKHTVNSGLEHGSHVSGQIGAHLVFYIIL